MLEIVLKTCEQMLLDNKSDEEIFEYLLKPDTVLLMAHRNIVDLVYNKPISLRGNNLVYPPRRLAKLYKKQKNIRIAEYNILNIHF